MDQKNKEFVPRLLPVVKGQEIRFLNSDKVQHNVFSPHEQEPFDLGLYPAGESKSVTLNSLKRHKVYCNLHKNMVADILVLPSPYYSLTDEKEVIGAVAVGMLWSMEDLTSIRELSHAEIAFFDDTGAFLSSGPPFTPQTGADEFTAWTHLSPTAGSRSIMLQSGAERFVVVKVDEPDEVSPPYMIARSLDQQMAFLNLMRRWLLELGI